MIRLLLHNALRVDEVLGADISDLGTDRGHQVLTLLGKGNRRAKVPLTPATVAALHAYLDHRATPADMEPRSGAWRGMAGPLLSTTTGGRMRPSQLWELVRRLAAAAGITEWDRLSAHSLRHTGITLALDAGVPLRDVQDYARHRDARTTRRYDHSRDSLDHLRRLRRRRVPQLIKPSLAAETRRARTTLLGRLLHDDGLFEELLLEQAGVMSAEQ